MKLEGKIVKIKLTYVKISVEASATACDVELMILCVYCVYITPGR